MPTIICECVNHPNKPNKPHVQGFKNSLKFDSFLALAEALISFKSLAPRSKGSRSKPAEIVLGLSFPSLGRGRSRRGLISIRCCRSLTSIWMVEIGQIEKKYQKIKGHVQRAITEGGVGLGTSRSRGGCRCDDINRIFCIFFPQDL